MADRSINIAKAFSDPRLLGAALGDPKTWAAWIVVLKAAFAIPLTPEELAIFKQVAGGRSLPLTRVRELWCIIGRRGGKSRIAAALAVFIALFVKHRLSPGEKGLVLCLAASMEQAKVVFDYAHAFLASSPVLAKELSEATATELRLRNGIVISTHAASFRTIRGRSLVAVILDEVSFWRTEDSATPDTEVYSAVLPALATTRGMLIGISSPYRKVGLLHQRHKQFYGTDSSDVLVVQGSSRVFNSTLDEHIIAAFMAADPTASLSEWDAQFRVDLASYLDDQTIDAAIEHGRPLELPPIKGTYTFYRAFCDASGGVGRDSYTICVCHKEGDLFVVDLVRGTVGKFDPQTVTEEYARLLRDYGIKSITGDKYGQEWVAGAWRKCGIIYDKADIVKSDLYLNAATLFVRGLVRMPNHPTLVRELRLLELQYYAGGKQKVDHPKGGHDDFANVVAGALHFLALRTGYSYSYEGFRDVPIPGQQISGSLAYVRAYCWAHGLYI